MRTVHRTLAVALPALCLTAGRLRAQTPNVRIAGRIQAQFNAASGDSTDAYRPDLASESGFEIRRLRIQADVRIGENVTMVLQPSFEMGSLRMRDAYARVGLRQNATSRLGLTIGQQKKPFSRYELTSSNTLVSIERGARFRPFTAAQATVAAGNNILEYNGYIAHDIGADLDLTLASGRVAIRAGLYNGSGESAQDVNNAKSYGARATATVLRDAEQRPVLRVGGSFMSRDRAVDTSAVSVTRVAFFPDSAHRSNAFGLDLEWGDFRPGPHVIADFATGEHLPFAFSATGAPRNTGNALAGTPDSAYTTFATVQVVGSWRWQLHDPSGTRLIKIVEPALRVDLTDSDLDADATGSVLVTPALSLHFSQTTILRAGLDLYRYTDGTGARRTLTDLRISWQANF